MTKLKKQKNKTKAFMIHRPNGFALTFPNGNWLSTIWGTGSYTENYDWKSGLGWNIKDYSETIPEGSNDVEIMVNCSDKLFKKFQKKYDTSGSVIGHLSFNEWLEIVNLIAKDRKPK